VLTDYNYKSYDPETGMTTRDLAYSYNDKGQVIGVIDKQYDANGNLQITYTYGNYIYFADGKLHSYDLTTTDANGKRVITTIEVQANPDPTPNPTSSNKISGYYYDPTSGKLIPKYGNSPPGVGGNQ
jgi:hypothetical protein